MSTATKQRRIVKFISFVAPAIFAFLTACGGGKDEPPPIPKGMEGIGQGPFLDLHAKAQQMKAVCSKKYGVVLIPALKGAMGGNPYGAAQGMYPGMQGAQSQIIGMPPGGQMQMPLPPPQNECFQTIMNFAMQAKTICNGQCIADPQFHAWVVDQFKGVGNSIASVWAQNGVPLSPQTIQAAKGLGYQILTQQLIPQLPAGLGGLASSGLSQYMGGY